MNFRVKIFNLILLSILSVFLCIVFQSIQIKYIDNDDYGKEWILLPIGTVLLHIKSSLLTLCVMSIFLMLKNDYLDKAEPILFLFFFYFSLLIFWHKGWDNRAFIFPAFTQSVIILFSYFRRGNEK